MPPPLTEAWASAYLQILIGLLVFALGIPAFILQLVVHEDIRHVTERQMKITWWRLSLCLLALASVAFVWYLHPKTNEDGTVEQKWLASLIVTLVPLTVAILSFRLLKKYKRETVITNLKKTLVNRALPEKPVKRILRAAKRKIINAWLTLRAKPIRDYKSGITLKGETLEDFIYLGKHSKAGYQKELVLKAYKEIVKAVQSSADYQGGELKDLVQSLSDILKSGEIPGNEDNYYMAAELLAFIRENCFKRHRLVGQDADSVNLVLTDLGIESIKSKSERTALKFLNVGASCNCDIVVRMGIAAFQLERYLIATNALNILEAEVGRESGDRQGNGLKPNETTFRLLGLISYFVTSGDAARRRAQRFFASVGFDTNLKDCLRRAFDYHYGRTDFKTANNVAALLKLIEERKWPPPAQKAATS